MHAMMGVRIWFVFIICDPHASLSELLNKAFKLNSKRRNSQQSMSTPASTTPSGTTSTNGNSSSVSSGDESASHFQWEILVLKVLWMIVITILIALITIGVQKLRRSKEVNSSRCWHARSLSIVSCVSLLFAISLSLAPHGSCNFINTTDNNLGINIEAMGIWKVLRNNGNGNNDCYPYDLFLEPKEGAAVKATRALSVIASTFGGAAVAYYFVVRAFAYSQKFIPLFLVFVAIIQASTLVLLQSSICDDLTCELAEGSLASLTSFLYWLLAAWGISMNDCSASRTDHESPTANGVADTDKV